MLLSLLRRHEGWLSLTLVLALLVLGFISFQALFSSEAPQPVTPVPVAQRGAPALSVYPDHGPSGTYVGVTGRDWPSGVEVTILLASAQGESTVLVKETTAADGSLATGFLYPFDQRWLTPGSYAVVAESIAANVRATTPFRISDSPLPATVAPTVTIITAITPTLTLPATLTSLPTAAATVTAPPPTPLPSPIPTDTAVPTPLPTATPLPTDTPVPSVNQPPQVQAALVPIDIDDDRAAGIFQIQITATDPDGVPPTVVTILKLPLSDRERKVKLKEGRQTEIKFSNKELSIKAPNPQALLDQLTAYGGLVVEAGQQIDLRVKARGDGKLEWEEDHWRFEAPAIDLAVIATDAAGVSSRVEVSSCLEKTCQ